MPSHEEIQAFSMIIEDIVVETGLNYMEAICHHCENTGMEVEVAATLVSSSLKSKIQQEARNLNLIKKTSVLPI